MKAPKLGKRVRRPAAERPKPPPQSHEARRFWLTLVGICVVAAVVRFLILSEYLGQNPFARSLRSDALTYWNWAGRIAAGRWRESTPFLSAPLYPYLLGLIRACGGGLTAVYVIQVLFDLSSAALLSGIGWMRFRPRVGLLAAAIFLLLFEPASCFLRILPCSLQLLLVCLAWLSFIAFERSPGVWRAAICGLAVGVNCLATPAMMLLVPVMAVWILWITGRSAPAAGRAAAALAGSMVAILPATVHNWSACGEFIPVSAHAGITLYQGNAPGARWNYARVPGVSMDREQMHHDTARVFHDETGRNGAWAEIDRHFLLKALKRWGDDPVQMLKLTGRKAYAFLCARYYGDIYNAELERADGLSSLLSLAPIRTGWLLPMVVVVIVVWQRGREGRFPELMLFAAPLFVVVVFWYSPRYRLPVIPVAALAVAWALCRAWPWRSAPHWALGVAGALAVGLGLNGINRVTSFDSPALQRPEFEHLVGVALASEGRLDEAVAWYRRVLKAHPEYAPAQASLADALRLQGAWDEAIELARQAVRNDPDAARSRSALGITLAQRGRFAEALLHLERAVALNPGSPEAHTNLGMVLAHQGKLDQALVYHRTAVQLDPTSAAVRFNLGCALAQKQAIDEAVEALRETVRLDPRMAAAYSMLAAVLRERTEFAAAAAVLREGCRNCPQNSALANSLAWLLATCPDDAVRNGAEAIALARSICQGTDYGHAIFVNTLAAAYAENGDFEQATAFARRAAELAAARGDVNQSRFISGVQALYEAGRPYRETERQ